MVTLEQYFDGTAANARATLGRYAEYVTTLRTLNEAYFTVLPAIGKGREGVAVFAGMSHSAFLAGSRLAASGELLSANMALRGCVENAIYGFFLFHHPELKPVWMARHDNDESRAKIRREFTVGRMKSELREKDPHVADQFELVYEASIDFGAHPNAMAFIGNLVDVPGSTDKIWQYVNLEVVDQAIALRMAAMAGLASLNILSLTFPNEFVASGANASLARAHEEIDALPEPGSPEEFRSAHA